ncbi:MAG: hypothetical protein JNL50_08510 [Phycisphaerae bacterium]|nr:hypothetical protein [Phycisphaerae bacterium]
MGNNIQLYIVLLMVTISVVSTIIKKGREAAEQRRVKLEIERRRLEALRTGRTEAQVAAEQAEEDPAAALARRREAQLEELRRIQRQRAQTQAQAQTQTQATGRAPVGARATPGRPPPHARQFPEPQTVPQPPSQAQARSQAQPKRQPKPASKPPLRPQESRTRQTAAQSTAEMFAAMERQRLQDTGESTTHRIVRDAAPPPVAAARFLPPSSGNPWRDAFLMQELLGPPLSMREARTPGLDSL